MVQGCQPTQLTRTPTKESMTYLKLCSRDSQRICTGHSPCLQQGCLVCCTPTNHVHNLTTGMNSPTTPSSPSYSNLPQPQSDHLIHVLVNGFQDAILDMKSEPDFAWYDLSNLCTPRRLAQSSTYPSTLCQFQTSQAEHQSLERQVL